MIKLVNCLLVVLLIAACGKEDSPVSISSCFDDEIENSDGCLTPEEEDSYCEVIEVGELLKIGAVAQQFLSLNCLEEGEGITLFDREGNSVDLMITHKTHVIDKRVFERGNCIDDFSKSHGECYQSERLLINLNNPFVEQTESELDSIIMFTAGHSFMNYLDTQILEIEEELKIFTYGTYSTLRLVIIDENVENGNINDLFINSIFLNGKQFDDVHTNPVEEGKLQFYLNSEYGLIGIKDYEQNIWSIQ